MNEQEALKVYLTYRPKAGRDIKWIMGWDETETIRANTKRLKIPNQPSASNFCQFYQLGFREGYHRVVKTDKECLKVLVDSGLTKSEVARLLGVSPERIRQLLEKRKK